MATARFRHTLDLTEAQENEVQKLRKALDLSTHAFLIRCVTDQIAMLRHPAGAEKTEVGGRGI